MKNWQPLFLAYSFQGDVVKKISIADLTLDVWLYVLLIKDVDRAASPTDHCARHKQLQVLYSTKALSSSS